MANSNFRSWGYTIPFLMLLLGILVGCNSAISPTPRIPSINSSTVTSQSKSISAIMAPSIPTSTVSSTATPRLPTATPKPPTFTPTSKPSATPSSTPTIPPTGTPNIEATIAAELGLASIPPYPSPVTFTGNSEQGQTGTFTAESPFLYIWVMSNEGLSFTKVTLHEAATGVLVSTIVDYPPRGATEEENELIEGFTYGGYGSYHMASVTPGTSYYLQIQTLPSWEIRVSAAPFRVGPAELYETTPYTISRGEPAVVGPLRFTDGTADISVAFDGPAPIKVTLYNLIEGTSQVIINQPSPVYITVTVDVKAGLYLVGVDVIYNVWSMTITQPNPAPPVPAASPYLTVTAVAMITPTPRNSGENDALNPFEGQWEGYYQGGSDGVPIEGYISLYVLAPTCGALFEPCIAFDDRPNVLYLKDRANGAFCFETTDTPASRYCLTPDLTNDSLAVEYHGPLTFYTATLYRAGSGQVSPPTVTPEPVGMECNRYGVDEAFAAAWEFYKEMIGCPLEIGMSIPRLAEEPFQGGHMFWVSHTDDIFVVYDRTFEGQSITNGNWRSDQSWNWGQAGEPDPDGIGLSPPEGLFEPKRGFGWVWRTFLGRETGSLGWALAPEIGFDNLGVMQTFENAIMLKASGPTVYVLMKDGHFYTK